MTNVDFNQWFHAPVERHTGGRSTAKLFCFPYAGGGPSAYHLFCKMLPGHVTPYVARLPGREATRNRPALTDIHDIIEQLTQAIRPAIAAEPVFFWGHSMGALVAFEVARLLNTGQGPRKLIVSGHRAPQIPSFVRPVPVEQMDDASFVQLLQRYNGIPQVILNNPDLLNLLLPQLRADFVALDRYRYSAGVPLACDILCINGELDRLIGRSEVFAWREQTSGNFSSEWLPGGHFFIHESRMALVQLISEAIDDELVQVSTASIGDE